MGFVIHPTQSILKSSKQIQYLGVIINSETMTVSLTPERINSLKADCKKLLKRQVMTVREVAQVIGKMVASFPAVRYGPLHYCSLENDKKEALKRCKGDFDKTLTLATDNREELSWWIDNVQDSYINVRTSKPDVVVTSDASFTGWGCDCEGVHSGGQWLPAERMYHMNYLELKAVFFALQCFLSKLQSKHVRLMMDNTTAMACINHMGTNHSLSCNQITQAIWNWCISNKIWINAAHIPGRENVVANHESRRVNLDAEWKLDSSLLQTALSELERSPTIDLFASRLSAQLPRYVSVRPDPIAVEIDAFSLCWKDKTFYAFTPFSIIAQVLQKVQQDQGTGILVVPDWPSQVWYPVIHRLLLSPPVRLPCRTRLLRLPSQPEAVHPLIQRRHLSLLVCKISGRPTSSQD